MRTTRSLAAMTLIALATLTVGCSDKDPVRAPDAVRRGLEGGGASLVVEADLPIARLVVSIDDGMGRREVELKREEKEGLLAGAIDIAAGVKARLAFSAYDEEGLLTHQGKGTLVAGKEMTPQVQFALTGMPGADQAGVRIGTYRLALSPSVIVAEPGSEVNIQAVMLDARGEPHQIEKGALQPMAGDVKDLGGFGFDPRDWYLDIRWRLERNFDHLRFCTFDNFACGLVIVQDPNPVIQVVAASNHSCALRKSGRVSCWGENAIGQLGKDAAGNSVISGIIFKSISASGLHSCGVDDAGAVRCWGTNLYGQLGLGGIGGWSPNANVVNLPATATQVTAGGNHSCALLTNGETWCWGLNAYGQLGNGSAIANPVVGISATPVKVATSEVFVSISAGLEHVCGITAAGVAWCWGGHQHSELGFDPAGSDKCAVNATVYPTTWVNCAATPRQVQTNETFAGIGSGVYATCAWTAGGTGFCWGRAHGSFPWNGNKNWIPRTPTTQPSWKFLTAGGQTQCGIDASDMVQCFGDTQWGQTGTGIGLPTTTVNTPTPVTAMDTWTSVDAGQLHGCGVRAQGFVVSCYGNNQYGQLGRVTPSGMSATPVDVTASY